MEAHLTHTTDQHTAISAKAYDASGLMRTLIGSTSFPNDAALDVVIEPDEHGDSSGVVAYASSTGLLPLRLYSLDESSALMYLDIESLPQSFDATFKATTCGFRAAGTLGDIIGRIYFTRTPGNAEETADSPGPSSSVSPGCPESAATKSGDAKPGRTTITATVQGIPAGTMTLDMKTGSAGSAELTSTGGAIDHVHAIVETVDEKGTSLFNIDARDVILRAANWDIDGETRYENNPNVLYLSTGGAATGRIVLDMLTPDKGRTFLDTNGRVIFGADGHDGFQMKWYTGPDNIMNAVTAPSFVPVYFEKDETEIAGCLRVLDQKMTVQLAGHSYISRFLEFKREVGGGIFGRCA